MCSKFYDLCPNSGFLYIFKIVAIFRIQIEKILTFEIVQVEPWIFFQFMEKIWVSKFSIFHSIYPKCGTCAVCLNNAA